MHRRFDFIERYASLSLNDVFDETVEDHVQYSNITETRQMEMRSGFGRRETVEQFTDSKVVAGTGDGRSGALPPLVSPIMEVDNVRRCKKHSNPYRPSSYSSVASFYASLKPVAKKISVSQTRHP